MRPRDEDGHLLPVAHIRLPMAAYQQAALFAMAEDPRACALPVKRKLAMIDKAVDHVVDGDARPHWIVPNPERPGDNFLVDLWRTAVHACQRVKREQKHG